MKLCFRAGRTVLFLLSTFGILRSWGRNDPKNCRVEIVNLGTS